MTLSEWFHLTHGYDLSSAGGDELADALRADGWRIVKLETATPEALTSRGLPTLYEVTEELS